MWFSLRSLSFSFNYFSFLNCCFDHCEFIISYYLFSLTITMRWSWNDRRRKEENCWKKKHWLNCVVSCVCLWIEKRVKVAKILKAEIRFRAKKRRLDVVFKRFEIRFVRLNVYDLFCRFFSKRNDFVLIEDDEKKILIVKITSFRIDLTTTSRLMKRIDSRWASRISTTTTSRVDESIASRWFRRSRFWIDWKIASRSKRR